MPEPTGTNQLYQAGFTKVPVGDHRTHFVFAVMDCFSRYLLALRVSAAATPQDLIGGLDAALHEARKMSDLHGDQVTTLVTDSGPTFTAPDFLSYLSRTPFRHVPSTGRPFQSLGMIRRVFWTLRDEEIETTHYRDPVEAQLSMNRFRHIYNFERPHQALGYRFPGDLFCRQSGASA